MDPGGHYRGIYRHYLQDPEKLGLLRVGDSLIVTVAGTAGCVITSLFATYALSRIKFRFSGFWFGCVMLTMMIPQQVMVVPQYIILKKLHLIDTRTALVLSWFFGGAFFIFLMVQFFRGIPRELDEAAENDGCGKLAILFRIMIPIVKPAIVTSSLCVLLDLAGLFPAPDLYEQWQ
ncbi:Binding-protein-dependent transport system inner membrane component [Enterocloster clostridioformis]|uniref:Binding-protein-dependent transport systems inner membrane component n=2 Tax=Enterocloster clostridioformis TaxID=1531 RepID=A0A2X2TS37_9FIRM|nr:Binding-protein-dependent transport system inner membrane component [Enterocloster clostridioformis]SQB04561.1 binding-protein-dependent transport systems inner membrane component [Enterocloster clostridioformis]